MLTLEQSNTRWKAGNHDGYTEGTERTQYLIELIQTKCRLPVTGFAEILELGCNVGRNLNGLQQAGYKHLSGVEININTKAIREHCYPELKGTFQYQPLEEFVLEHNHTYNLIYTMAVLEHIHPQSAWIFEHFQHLLKPQGYLITIEDEKNYDGLDFVFPRSYQDAFAGLLDIYTEDASQIPGLKAGYVTRIYQRP